MKILVIRLSSLGDVVLTLPVIQAIKRTYPQAHLTFLVKDAYADALATTPEIDERMLLGPHESLVSLIRRVRQNHYDVIVDLHANLRSRLITALSGAKRIYRYKKAALARRLFVRWRLKPAELERHTLDRYRDAVNELVGPSPDRLRSVLVIQTAFLGDAVLTTPMLNALKERFPSTRVTVVATPEIAEVFRHPAVDELILFDKRGAQTSWLAFIRLIRQIRRRHFDVALLPHRSFRSALLAWLAAIPRRIGFSASQAAWLLTDRVRFEWGTHDVDRNLALLAPLGIAAPQALLGMKPDRETVDKVRQRLSAAGVAAGQRLVGINAGSVWATKRWIPQGFAAVADRLIREEGIRILFIGAPKDRPVVNEVATLMKEPSINWTGETTMKELVAAISCCSAFLTNDSGPMHVAVALGIPTVAIFGPTTKELGFFPYGPGHIVLEKPLECRPCGLHGAEVCPLGHFQCMHLITPEEVFQAVKAQLAR